MDLVEESVGLRGVAAGAAPARRGGAPRRARLRARGVPALLGRAVAERRRARAPRRRALAAGRARARARLRARAAEPRRRARRRARARDRLVAAGDRAAARRTPRATARRSRPRSSTGRARRRSSSARRGTSCSPPTCSTSAATCRCCSTLLPAPAGRARRLWLADPGRAPAERAARGLAEGWERRDEADGRVTVHRLMRAAVPSRQNRSPWLDQCGAAQSPSGSSTCP